MNGAVSMKNLVTVGDGGKWIVCPFRSQEFWKCIGCVLSVVKYRNKGNKLWIKLPKYYVKMAPTKL